MNNLLDCVPLNCFWYCRSHLHYFDCSLSRCHIPHFKTWHISYSAVGKKIMVFLTLKPSVFQRLRRRESNEQGRIKKDRYRGSFSLSMAVRWTHNKVLSIKIRWCSEVPLCPHLLAFPKFHSHTCYLFLFGGRDSVWKCFGVLSWYGDKKIKIRTIELGPL